MKRTRVAHSRHYLRKVRFDHILPRFLAREEELSERRKTVLVVLAAPFHEVVLQKSRVWRRSISYFTQH